MLLIQYGDGDGAGQVNGLLSICLLCFSYFELFGLLTYLLARLLTCLPIVWPAQFLLKLKLFLF